MKALATRLFAATAAAVAMAAAGEPAHDHPVPERLGTVHFATSCAEAVRGEFDHAAALLHSFAYDPAAKEFNAVAARDRSCAIAHWGVAMAQFHQLWNPPGRSALELGRRELLTAQQIGAQTPRERELIDAALLYFSDEDPAHHRDRALAYAQAMASAAQRYTADDEVQIAYALALIGTAPPTDRSHANQKRAAAILEPIYERQPDHPGVAHYLIHAYDSQELAPRGLTAARAYSKIAPSAPHALHMPSHIFTRLGLWDDSIESNEAARRAAREQGDTGEELHAMDYLTYAYLQRGRAADAERIVQHLREMSLLPGGDFKVGYAATAMPVRLAVEGRRWRDATTLEPLAGSAPHVAALVHWARAIGHARSGELQLADADIQRIDACATESRARGDTYWAGQTEVLAREARAWGAQAAGHADEAVALLLAAADAEDAVEKLSVTPGPIVPAREQLGELLFEIHRPADALRELKQSLKDSPGRRAGLEAASRAAEATGDKATAAGFRKLLAS